MGSAPPCACVFDASADAFPFELPLYQILYATQEPVNLYISAKSVR